jgi:hypothetical protein
VAARDRGGGGGAVGVDGGLVVLVVGGGGAVEGDAVGGGGVRLAEDEIGAEPAGEGDLGDANDGAVLEILEGGEVGAFATMR